MNLAAFFSGLKQRRIALWNESGKLKAFLPKGITLDPDDKEFIAANKGEILAALTANNVTTQADFTGRTIFKNLHPGTTYPLSFAQERLWFLEQFEGGSSAYHIPMAFDLGPGADLEAFNTSITALAMRHEVLRTVFCKDDDGNEYQSVLDVVPDPIREERITEKSLPEKFASCLNQPFDLINQGPLKVFIFMTETSKYALILVHHIAFDGWSMEIFLRELEMFYLHYRDAATLNLSDTDIQYRDFALWQKAYLAGSELTRQLDFWKNELQGFETLEFPTDRSRPARVDYRGGSISFTLTEDLSTQLRNLAARKKVTLFTLLASTFSILLHKYTGQNNLIIGTPTAGRNQNQLDNVIGFFVNSMALKIAWEDDPSCDELVEQVSRTLANTREYQDLPFEKLVDALDLEQDLSRHPIFQIMFGVQSFADTRDSVFTSLPLDAYYQPAKFDLSLFVDENGPVLKGVFNYAVSLFDASTIERITSHYINILEQVTSDSGCRLGEIDMLSPAEYEQMVYTWNETGAPYPSDATIVQLFEEQVAKTPDAAAVLFQDEKLTYAELNERANQLAHTIRRDFREYIGSDIQSDTLIGIYIGRCVDMIVGILGILKSGAAYVPFDSDDPQERLKFKINNCGCKMVLTSSDRLEDLVFLAETDTLPISLDAYAGEIAGAPVSNPERINTPEDLAYIIYTSGSTGRPKGVMLENRSVINYVYNFKNSTAQGRKVQDLSSSLSFDLTVTTTLAPLLTGNTIAIYPGSLKNLDEYIDHIRRHGVTFLKTVPSLLYLLLQRELPASLTEIFVGGEKLSRNLLSNMDGLTIFDEYGPTEATVGTTLSCIFPDNQSGIGRPYANYRIYILDENLRPVPVGVPGEMYIGGDSLARGYFRRPDLTKERFIPNPFATDEEREKGCNLRMYKTGDVARRLPDGNIEYLGRNDDQVKISGFRVELGEIENKLAAYSGIAQCVVICREHNGIKYLCAYFTADREIRPDALRDHLAGLLPYYMVPQYVIQLAVMPLTVNDKVDRRALPEPAFTGDAANYAPPRSDTEDALCRLWQEELGVHKVGIGDDFFRLGGSSILAIRLCHKMTRMLGREIPVASLFDLKTIKAVSEGLGRFKRLVKIEPCPKDHAVLSFAQERLYFIEEYEGGSTAYNIPMLYELADDMDIPALKKGIVDLVDRQEVLRTVFVKSETGDVYQKVGSAPLEMQHVDLAAKDLQDRVEQAINTVFDLHHQYPVRVVFYHTETKKFVLINVHHIAFDGWSTDIFLRELDQLYRHHRDGSRLSLPELDIQYRDFAAWQRDFLSGDTLQAELDYWQETLKGYETFAFPTDKPRPAAVQYDGDYYTIRLDRELSEELRTVVRDHGTTAYSLFLSAFYILLHTYSGEHDVLIGTPTANRHYAQLEHLIGFFVNSTVLRCRFTPDLDIRGLMENTASSLSDLQLHQDLPFEKLIDLLQVEKDPSRHPLFQIMFSLQSFGEDETSGTLDYLTPVDSSELYKIAKFDLSLLINDATDAISCGFNYATSLFERPTIVRMARHYQEILKLIARGANKHIRDIVLLSPSEYDTILRDWNETGAVYPGDRTIVQIFEDQAAATPDACALVFEQETLSYRELNRRANRLAHTIRRDYAEFTGEEIAGDTLIGIYIERSVHMIVGILGILKSGAAYVPFDPADPGERLRFKIGDCACRMILTSSTCISDLVFLTEQETLPVALDAYQDEIAKSPAVNPVPVNTSRDLAYIIYTSGSTGTPKGVMIEHYGVVNLALSHTTSFAMGTGFRILQFAPMSFDASVSTLFCALLSGGCLCLCTEELRKDVLKLAGFIVDQRIDLIDIPAKLLELMPRDVDFPHLKHIITAGEVCDKQAMDYWSERVGLVNAYGPTEATVCTTMGSHAPAKSNLNIGTPISNKKVYVLDASLNPVPVGVPGELYIGGDGLARGYLNREETTAERFVPDPFLSADGSDHLEQRMYKSGDMVRWTANGELIFLGRNDDQVKIHGYRIELSEVEQKLSQFKGIGMCAVRVFEREQNTSLCAYYTLSDDASSRGQRAASEEIRTYLATVLPEYMIPAYYVELERFPMNTSGKIDRKNLPEPDVRSSESDYIEPETDLQKQLCAIFEELLGVDRVGITDDFFRMGGDSILSIQLSSRLKNAGLECAVKDLFKNPTVAKLAEHLSSGTEKEVAVIAEQGILEGAFDLLPIQEWFFDKVASREFPEYNHWNQSFMVRVPLLDTDRFEQAVFALVAHHDMLRTTFEGGKQRYNREIVIPALKMLDRSGLSDEEVVEILTGWQSGFDIEHGPLWQFGYVTGYDDGSARLYFALHHLIVDAVSWRILLEDIRRGYEGTTLGEKTSSYRQWVAAIKAYPQQHEDEKACWENLIESLPDYTPWGEKHDQPLQREIRLSEEITGRLLKEANEAYFTGINDLLLTAFAYALQAWQGAAIQGITLEGHGRENIDPSLDHSHTLGWFTNVYPVRLNLGEDLGQSIMNIKQSLRQIPAKGIGWGAFCRSHDRGAGDSCFQSDNLPPVTFNYLGQLGSGAANGDWEIAAESSGISIAPANIDTSLVAVNSAVSQGRFNFQVASRLGQEATDRLVGKFEASLKEIVEHCLAVREQGTAPGYDNEDFEYIPTIALNQAGRSDKLAILIHPDSGYEAYMATLYPVLSKDIRVILVDNFYKKVYLQDGVLLEKYHFKAFCDLSGYYVDLLVNEYGDLLTKSRCCLIGYSFGSPIAYEMDRIFREQGIQIDSLVLIDPLIPSLLKTPRELNCFAWYTDYRPTPTPTPITHFRCTQPDPVLPGYTEYFIDPGESSLASIAGELEEVNFACSHTTILGNPDFIQTFKEIANRGLEPASAAREVPKDSVARKNTIENAVASIIGKVLELEPEASIDSDENILLLGCTSIQSLSILAMLNETWAINLALSDIIQHFTVAGLADLVRGGLQDIHNVDVWKPAEFTAKKANADRLYFFPGLIGSVSSYNRICTTLANTFNVVFMEPKGMYGTMVPFADYAEAIKAYADEIVKRDGPDASIYLAGHSVGSIHSLDTALMLEAKGFTNLKLINIDGYLHGITNIKESIHGDNLDEALLGAIKIFFERGSESGTVAKERSHDPLQEMADILFPSEDISRDYALRVALGYRNIWHQQLHEMLSYVEPEQTFKGDVLLFLTKEAGKDIQDNILASCRKRYSHEFRHDYIAGDHLSCITLKKHVEEIYDLIRTWIESVSENR
jgi:amino acid adenylation domain-containing protein/non-ribosomal peptide synthase protein (TIGR01720 family)